MVAVSTFVALFAGGGDTLVELADTSYTGPGTSGVQPDKVAVTTSTSTTSRGVTTGTYTGFKVIKANNHLGVVVDLEGGELNINSARTLIVGVKFINGRVTVTAPDVYFWWTYHEYGYTSYQSLNFPYKSASTPRLVNVQQGGTAKLYGVDIGEYADDGLVTVGGGTVEAYGLRIAAPSSWTSTRDSAFATANTDNSTSPPTVILRPDAIHTDAVQTQGKFDSVTLHDADIAYRLTILTNNGATNDAITFECENTWLHGGPIGVTFGAKATNGTVMGSLGATGRPVHIYDTATARRADIIDGGTADTAAEWNQTPGRIFVTETEVDTIAQSGTSPFDTWRLANTYSEWQMFLFGTSGGGSSSGFETPVTVQAFGDNGTATTITVGSGDGWGLPTAGNLIVVSATIATDKNKIVSVTDQNGDLFTIIGKIDDAGTTPCVFHAYKVAEGDESAITVTLSVSVAQIVFAFEVSNIDTSDLTTDVAISTVDLSSNGTSVSVSLAGASADKAWMAAAVKTSGTVGGAGIDFATPTGLTEHAVTDTSNEIATGVLTAASAIVKAGDWTNSVDAVLSAVSFPAIENTTTTTASTWVIDIGTTGIVRPFGVIPAASVWSLSLAGAPTVGFGTTITTADGIVLSVQFSPTTDPLETPVWTQIASFVREASGIQIRRGRSSELDKFQAGTCEFTLDNRDLDFDPQHTTGPFYPNLLPMRRVRVVANYGAVEYPLFEGFILGWPQSYDISDNDSVVVVRAVDAFEILENTAAEDNFLILDDDIFGRLDINRLGGADVTITEESAGGQLDTVLNIAGWPTGERDLGVGVNLLEAGTLSGSVLAYCQTVEASEDGFFFVAKDGDITFLGRDARWLTPRLTTTQFTFADDGADVPYADVALRYDRDYIYNDVIRTGSGEPQRASDSVSMLAYGRRRDEKTGLVCNNVGAKAIADYRVSRFSEPMVRPEPVRVPVRSRVSQIPTVLGAELLDRVTLERRAMGGTVRTFTGLVQSIELNLSQVQFDATFTISPGDVDDTQYLELDSATNGLLGTAALAF